MTPETLTADSLTCLRAFQRAAAQIREASLLNSDQTLGFAATAQTGSEPQVAFQLFAQEPFRSLAMSVRLIYMQKEPAQFHRICNILYQHGNDSVRAQVAEARRIYDLALDGGHIIFNLHGEMEGQKAGPRDVFEAWLYGVAFHQDPARLALVDELSKYQHGQAFPYAVNLIALRLIEQIMALDAVVSSFLGEKSA